MWYAGLIEVVGVDLMWWCWLVSCQFCGMCDGRRCGGSCIGSGGGQCNDAVVLRWICSSSSR